MAKTIPDYQKVFIKQSAGKSILAGYPWCFAGNIEKVEPGLNNGDLCGIVSGQNSLGIGYYHKNTDIALRVLSRTKQAIDTDFFIKKVQVLKEQKEIFLDGTNAYRLIYGESDGLPGLVADVYNRSVVLQVHTLGIEKLKNNIINAIIHVMKPDMIYERSHTGIRIHEGLGKECSQLLYGKQKNEIDIIENDFNFRVNIVEGQKTGFFLDQRDNRKALLKYCKGKKVLNCFCYTGGFSVYAASIAESVTSVDISKPAIEGARVNFSLNGYDLNRHEFLALDVFDYLKTLHRGQYDVIILDPPSFAKNKDQLGNAIKAYTTINAKALEKLSDFGILVTSSCSTQVDEAAFIQMLKQSALHNHCGIKVLESRIQPPDHTYNLAFPEGRYLKFFVLQKWPLL
jgi:23S rRNA (cytosine1962-C5)-methyltransferase